MEPRQLHQIHGSLLFCLLSCLHAWSVRLHVEAQRASLTPHACALACMVLA